MNDLFSFLMMLMSKYNCSIDGKLMMLFDDFVINPNHLEIALLNEKIIFSSMTNDHVANSFIQVKQFQKNYDKPITVVTKFNRHFFNNDFWNSHDLNVEIDQKEEKIRFFNGKFFKIRHAMPLLSSGTIEQLAPMLKLLETDETKKILISIDSLKNFTRETMKTLRVLHKTSKKLHRIDSPLNDILNGSLFFTFTMTRDSMDITIKPSKFSEERIYDDYECNTSLQINGIDTNEIYSYNAFYMLKMLESFSRFEHGTLHVFIEPRKPALMVYPSKKYNIIALQAPKTDIDEL